MKEKKEQKEKRITISEFKQNTKTKQANKHKQTDIKEHKQT